ncbi:hypothetical protein [Micromonospora sp. WMMD1274]|uniref:hypothetical protein n=1 Tax=Micromonospora sp. WMMD1274 TaxID=3404116 RepID=UPI003B959568
MMRFPGFGRDRYRPGRRNKVFFAGAPDHPLDLVKPPGYELDESWRAEIRAQVLQRIESLKPGAIDAGTREVVHNYINAQVQQSLKAVEGMRDERRAIARVLVGIADEEVARRKPRFDVDFARACHAIAAAAIAFEKLTGRPATDYLAAAPERAGDRPLYSTVGRIDLGLDEPAAAPDERPARSDPDLHLTADPDMPTFDREERRHG